MTATADAPADEEYIEAVLLHSLAAARGKEIDRGVCLIGPHRDAGGSHRFSNHPEMWSTIWSAVSSSVTTVRSATSLRSRMSHGLFATGVAGAGLIQ